VSLSKPPSPTPSPEDTGARVRRVYERAYAPGEMIFSEGDPGEVLYVIQAGEVELTRTGPQGPRLIERLGSGEFFGEMSVVIGGPRSLCATAVTQVQLIELDSSTLQLMCIDRPEIAIRLIRRLAARVIDLEKRLAMLGGDDLLRPLVRALLRGAEPDAQGVRIFSTLRRLSQEAGLSLRDAHHALQQLFDRKLLRLNEDVLYAPDLEALNACLDSTD